MQNTLLFSIAFLLFSCATKLRPTGGEKDTSPPVLKSAQPVSGSTQFNGNQFELKFDEFLKRENFENLILVSPRIEDLKVDYRGKKLVISWKNELEANTTYNFQFLQSIKDYTESNVLSNFQYVLSTGNQIDSLKISGQVDWLDSKPNSATLICLVEENQFNDSTFLRYNGFQVDTVNWSVNREQDLILLSESRFNSSRGELFWEVLELTDKEMIVKRIIREPDDIDLQTVKFIRH